jgi:hypothetical protein
MEINTNPSPGMWLSTYSDVTVWQDAPHEYYVYGDVEEIGATEVHLWHSGGGIVRTHKTWPTFETERIPPNWIIT